MKIEYCFAKCSKLIWKGKTSRSCRQSQRWTPLLWTNTTRLIGKWGSKLWRRLSMTINQCFRGCKVLKVTITESSGKRIFKNISSMNKKSMKIATVSQGILTSCTRFAHQMKLPISSLNADFNLQTLVEELPNDTCQANTDTVKCLNKLSQRMFSSSSSKKFKTRKWRWKTPPQRNLSMTTTTLSELSSPAMIEDYYTEYYRPL